jgi:hypothetical protein
MSDLPSIESLQTRKNEPGQSRVVQSPAPADLQADEVLFRLHRFALTTNNITYAVFGDAMRYWDFFPTGDAEWGHMPVWGYGDVVASRATGVEVGERFYGYFPMASHLRVKAASIKPAGFMDAAAHRQPLAAIYNLYSRCSADEPAMPTRFEDAQLIVRPLFTTAFLCADFLQAQSCFGARRIVISSASSKTAYASAYQLKAGTGVELVGLTSPANRAFVEATGCYHRVVGYGELDQLAADVPTLYLDFAGSVDLRTAEQPGQHRHALARSPTGVLLCPRPGPEAHGRMGACGVQTARGPGPDRFPAGGERRPFAPAHAGARPGLFGGGPHHR